MRLPSLILFAVMCGFLGIACSNDSSAESDFSESSDIQGAQLVKVKGHLYAIEFNEFDFEKHLAKFQERHDGILGGCSEVRKGNFIGRNLDWVIGDKPTVVVKMNNSPFRQASIGVVGAIPELTMDAVMNGVPQGVLEEIPLATIDGINASGVYVGVNMMPTGETSLDSSKWSYGEWGLGAAYTNPENKDSTYDAAILARFILDNATSVDHAKKLISRVNWYESRNFVMEGFTQAMHWIIADSSKTVILEFLDNKPYFVESTDISKPSYATIVTNFSNKLMSDGIVQPHGSGYERYDVLKDHYDSTPETFDGLHALMMKVWFTLAYTKPLKSPDFFATDFVDDGFSAQDLYSNPQLWENEDFYDIVSFYHEAFKDTSRWLQEDALFWYTEYTSVYDIKNRSMKMLLHEGMDDWKEYIEVGLDSDFRKFSK